MTSFTERVRQVFHVDMDVAGLIGFEGAVFWFDGFGLEIVQVADTMTSQAPVQARARSVRIKELAHHRQQIIERNQKRRAQGHRNGFLRRGQ